MTEEKKFAYRRPPCPEYHMEAMESWLEDQAREGLLLEDENPFFGFLTFRKTAPQSVRYRLEPAEKTQNLLDSAPGAPKVPLLELTEALGWEYLCRFQQYFIYRSVDPQAPELHTDPQIQSQTLLRVKKRQRREFLLDIAVLLFYLFFGVLGYPVGLCILLGVPAALIFMGLFLWMLIRPLRSVCYLQRLRKKIQSGSGIDHRFPWRAIAPWHRACRLLGNLLTLYLVFALGSTWVQNASREMAHAEYTQPLPFVTMADFSPEGKYEAKGFDQNNTVSAWSHAYFPTNFEWSELAEVTLEGGTALYGSLNVGYHEVPTPFLAKELARELMAYHRADFWKPILVESEEIQGVTVYRFSGKYHYRCAVLVRGTTVVRADFLVDSSEENRIASTWIQMMAERLSQTDT